jgi:hypothetical protein
MFQIDRVADAGVGREGGELHPTVLDHERRTAAARALEPGRGQVLGAARQTRDEIGRWLAAKASARVQRVEAGIERECVVDQLRLEALGRARAHRRRCARREQRGEHDGA